MVVEVVDDGEDEAPDRADELKPFVDFHARHLLPSRKKPTHQTAARIIAEKISYRQRDGIFLLRRKIFARIIAEVFKGGS